MRVGERQDPYQAAVNLVVRHQNASVALVQCHLRIGYRAACALFERMQAQGIVTTVVAAGWVWTLSPAYRRVGESATDQTE